MEPDQVVLLAHSNAVRGVEIFDVGTHNGDKYTEQDVDDMVDAFSKLDYRPALKVGHTKDFPGAPSFGFVTNLRKVGKKLVADFESMHDSVVQALKDKRYTRVSSEIYFNLKRGGKSFRRALKAVALLGTEVPAVSGLTPLHKMEFAAEGSFDSLAQNDAQHPLEVESQTLIAALSERVAGLSKILTEQKEQDAMKIKELRDQKSALEAQLAALQAKKDLSDADKGQIKKFEEDLANLGKSIDGEIEALAAKAAQADALASTVQALQAKDRDREVIERVAKCSVPAFRPDLESLYRHAVANPEVKIVHFAAADKDGKRAKSERSLSEALDSLVGSINSGASKLFTATASAGTPPREEGPRDGNAGQELHQKASQRVADKKSRNYEEACDAVLAEDADLKARYHAEQAAATSH